MRRQDVAAPEDEIRADRDREERHREDDAGSGREAKM
jgi:hypothetical protein